MYKAWWYFLSIKSFYEGYLARTKVDAHYSATNAKKKNLTEWLILMVLALQQPVLLRYFRVPFKTQRSARIAIFLLNSVRKVNKYNAVLIIPK